MLRRPPRSTLFPYTSSSDLMAHESGSGRGDCGAARSGARRGAHTAGGGHAGVPGDTDDLLGRSEEHTSELQSLRHLVCRLLLEKKKRNITSEVTIIQSNPVY